MGTLIVSLEIEERHVDDGIELTIRGIQEQEGDVSPATIRLGNALSEQMRLGVIAAKTTMNERI